MAEWAAKRFWKETTVAEAGGGYTVHLDGRAVRTPAKAPLVVPSRELADWIASEWEAQENEINPNTMPATRSANAAIDKVTIQHAEVADMLAEYGDSDLLCYRADFPTDLINRQAASWDPILEWAEGALSAKLTPRSGVIHAPQDPDALARLSALTHEFDAFQLTAFHDLVGLSGSLILGFAVTQGYLDPNEAWRLSRIDEDFQVEQWGEDEEAAEAAEVKRQSFLHAARFYCLVK
ncbi:ATP12 family chaperone protein [Celeribacter litoreus]|uniref:ATP12 family chaperone protein n=1 Tax=Celeribacter litoreus TaxID=2876714 RepID=UPI001CCE4C7B|nr:ATP12 family protein [Celeribacter litoreus]MCA0042453.1 ATPase [Celeribacter litoreus]